MNRNSFLLIFVIIALLSTGCSETTLTAEGEVTYITVEGGFWGIIGSDGRHYIPLNLSNEYKREGIKIEFSYIVNEEKAGSHVWGVMIEIEDVTVIGMSK